MFIIGDINTINRLKGMKNKILEIINKYPKHYSRMVSSDLDMKEWVMTNTLLTDTENFSAHVYSAVKQETNICTNNKQKRFTGINSGFGFCGKANVCKCCYESVSESVSKSKNNHTDEQKKLIQAKREKTSLDKYGVINNGQTTRAKAAHRLSYQNIAKVEKINTRIKNTKKINHGDETFNNREKAVETYKQRYGYENPVHLKQMNQNKNLELLKNKETLEELYNKFTVDEISAQLEVHQQTVYRYLNLHQLREPYTSTFEKEITNYLNDLGITNIVSNTRKLISKEIDIYLPDYNLAIEYNGVYWHHDQIEHIDKYYHYNKFKECEDKGIELFTIFSDSWEVKKEVWKAKIKQKLGLSTNIMYARKCVVKEIDPKETRAILEGNHVQGYCTAQIALGLYHDNELVAAMTFSNKRAGIGKDRGIKSYELVRYVTSKRVIGGAGKVLKAFIERYTPETIYSYSDNRYSTGNLYKTLGFKLDKENKCGYFYFDDFSIKSYHRFKFTKFRLVEMGHDPDNTEYEIMKNLGYMRIWDCGTRTWVLNVNTTKGKTNE